MLLPSICRKNSRMVRLAVYQWTSVVIPSICRLAVLYLRYRAEKDTGDNLLSSCIIYTGSIRLGFFPLQSSHGDGQILQESQCRTSCQCQIRREQVSYNRLYLIYVMQKHNTGKYCPSMYVHITLQCNTSTLCSQCWLFLFWTVTCTSMYISCGKLCLNIVAKKFHYLHLTMSAESNHVKQNWLSRLSCQRSHSIACLRLIFYTARFLNNQTTTKGCNSVNMITWSTLDYNCISHQTATLRIPQVIFREVCALHLYKGFGFEVKAQSSIMKLLSNDSDSSRDSPEEQQLSVQQASELKEAGQILTFLNKLHIT